MVSSRQFVGLNNSAIERDNIQIDGCPTTVGEELNFLKIASTRKNGSEKRVAYRYQVHLPILCSIFNSHEFNNTIRGEMGNYNEFGIGVSVQNQLQIGTVLLVQTIAKSIDYFSSNLRVGFRTTTLAEVKWFKSTSFDGRIWYIGGLRYLSVT
jgi:hypothetical protein